MILQVPFIKFSPMGFQHSAVNFLSREFFESGILFIRLERVTRYRYFILFYYKFDTISDAFTKFFIFLARCIHKIKTSGIYILADFVHSYDYVRQFYSNSSLWSWCLNIFLLKIHSTLRKDVDPHPI